MTSHSLLFNTRTHTHSTNKKRIHITLNTFLFLPLSHWTHMRAITGTFSDVRTPTHAHTHTLTHTCTHPHSYLHTHTTHNMCTHVALVLYFFAVLPSPLMCSRLTEENWMCKHEGPSDVPANKRQRTDLFPVKTVLANAAPDLAEIHLLFRITNYLSSFINLNVPIQTCLLAIQLLK